MAKYLTFNLVDCVCTAGSLISLLLRFLKKPGGSYTTKQCRKATLLETKKTGTNQVHTDELRAKIGLYMYAAEFFKTILNDLNSKINSCQIALYLKTTKF